MTDLQLSVECAEGVLRVHICRPEKRNALSRTVLAAIHRVFDENAGNTSLKYAVLTGTGDKSFAAGGDIKDLMSVRGAEAAESMALKAKGALASIRSFPVPVVAALNGDALGGGAELAVACDMRVAASHARIGFIQGRLAISSAWGGGVDLVRLVGPARAIQILSRSEVLTAPEASALGLINDVAVDDEPLADVLRRFTEPMQGQAPQVMRAFKALADSERNRGREAADNIETHLFGQTWAHPDHDAAVARLFGGA